MVGVRASVTVSANPSVRRSDIRVRLVGATEHTELRAARLVSLAYSDHLVEHLRRETAAPLDFWRDRAERGAAGTAMATYVAIDETKFCGLIDGFLSEDGRTVEIGGMWVSPALRRSGIGQELLGAVCEWARVRGAERAALWVRADNWPARLLYEGEGFELAATSNSGETGLRLERLLG